MTESRLVGRYTERKGAVPPVGRRVQDAPESAGPSRHQSQRGRLTAGVLTLVAGALVLATCGGGATSSTATTVRAEPTRSTSPSTTDPAGAAVLAAYRAAWSAFEQALATANPADPALAATMVNPQLQGVKANLLADQRQGMVGRRTFTLHPKVVSIGCRLRLQHGSARRRVHRQAGAAGHAAGERRGALNTRAHRRDLKDCQADRDGWEMRAWLVIPVAAVVGATTFIVGAEPAWAGDPGDQNTYADAQASGGQLTVQAGLTEWIPPASSSWGKATQPDPPPGKPNPNQPYGCIYAAGGPSVTAALGVGGPQPGQWVFPVCAGPGAIDPMPAVWVTGAKSPAVTVQVTPIVVAEQAAKTLGLTSAVIEMAPPDGHPQLVNVATWLWVNPAAWQPVTATAAAGPVTTTAVAAPSRVVWTMGDGSTVTCNGPGTPYDASRPDASTSRSYTWSTAGTYTVSATIYRTITWAAAGAAGGRRASSSGAPSLGIGQRTGESSPDQPDGVVGGRLRLPPGKQVVHVGRGELGKGDGGDGRAEDVAEGAGVVGLGVGFDGESGEVAGDPALAPVGKGGRAGRGAGPPPLGLEPEAGQSVPCLGLGAEQATDPALGALVGGREVDLSDPAVLGSVVVDGAKAVRAVAGRHGGHGNPLLTNEQNASRRFLTPPCVTCGVAYGGECRKQLADRS